MRYLLSTLFVVISLSSCDDSFNPKTDFQQEYVLYCILDGDTTFQFATLNGTFDVSNFDPASFDGNTEVRNAVIRIETDSSEIILKDTTILLNNKEVNLYYTNEFKPDDNQEVNITAELPNGIRLLSSTTTPRAKNLTFSPAGIFTNYFVSSENDGLTLYWEISDFPSERVLYLPDLTVRYFKKEGNVTTEKIKKVPLQYFENNGELIPFYPVVITSNSIHFTQNVLSQALYEISEGDTNKFNYYIESFYFDLYILDNNLAPYYLTTQTFLDGFTVFVDNISYSNIEGGYGVFGSFFTRSLKISVDPSFLDEFGYRTSDDL
ncbi:MAG: hypothetical protein Kow0098_08320 [Ignavibacteriaceae bacterium]